ncbi:hypothetical protein BPY_22920 [Bifidobacterium psychraerophilum]|uniref:hypothetical protein n=1 Tax=Bifidobacterium psychraerophilum TaxID=218140 RepID=UPI00310FB995
MEKLGWDGNVQRISSPLNTKAQRVELAGQERISFFQAVADSYEPAVSFMRGNTTFTDGEYLYGYVAAMDTAGEQIFDTTSYAPVSYFTRVRIPPLVLDRPEGGPYTRYIPAPLIEDTSHPLFPNHAGTLPAWPR